MMKKVPYFVYIVRCSDGTLYTGTTNDIKRRITMHNTTKTGAKYTRYRRPVTIVHSEKYDTKSEALKREYIIKQLTKTEKEKLIVSAYTCP